MSLIARLGRRPPGFWFAVFFVVAALCTLPALTAGFYADDFLHLAKLQSNGTAGERLMSLFTFTTGFASTRALIADGTIPWWTSPDLHVQFFRPLSAALMLFDHAVFALRPFGYHLHSIFWWLLWLAGSALLFRRVLSARLAVFAFVLFAIDDAHWLPIGWIAGRNATVAMAFVVWGFLAYLRFREDGWRPGAMLALGAWALALLAGEVAMSGLMYVVAYELLRDRAPGVRAFFVGLRPLLPLGLLLIAYAVAYGLSGSGVAGSGAYINPIHDTRAFITAAASRVPAQFGALMVGAPLDLWLLTNLQPMFVAVGVAAIVVVVPWFVAATKALPPGDRNTARWLALGSAFSLIPTSAGLLGERSLAAASLGAAAMVAVLLQHGLKKLREVRRLRRAAVAVAVIALGLPNVVVAAPWLVAKLAFMSANGKALERVAATAEAAAPPPARAVLLWSDDALLAAYTAPLTHLTHPEALPSFRVLAMAPVNLQMTRTAPNELELSCVAGSLLISEWERLFRAPDQTLAAGTELPLQGLTVRIVDEIDGRPSRVRFRFDVPLEDPSLRFLEWRGRRLVPTALPPLGETRPVYRSPPMLMTPG